MVDLSQRLTQIRKERGMTVDQVVEISGVTKSTASKVFSGIETNPKMGTLLALLRAMDATLSDIDPVSIEKAPAPKERELTEKDKQIIGLLPFVPDGVKDGMLMILASTVDLAAAAESANQDMEMLYSRRAQADSDDTQAEQNG